MKYNIDLMNTKDYCGFQGDYVDALIPSYREFKRLRMIRRLCILAGMAIALVMWWVLR